MPETNESPKADCTLSDGTKVYFDKHKIKPKEWRELWDPGQSLEEGQAIMARFAGLEFEHMGELSMYDWQLLMSAAVRVVNIPVLPNEISSASKSTSQ